MKALVSVCLLLFAVPAAATSPALSFESNAVVAGGVTQRGQVVWFSIAREISRQAATIVPRIELQTDVDGEPDGTLRATLAALTTVGDGPAPPAHVSPGDLLLVIDSNRMTFLRSRIGS